MSYRPWWNLEPCGTPAAFRRHERAGEKPCQLCREAHNVDNRYRMRAYRARKAAQDGAAA
jgi:hypothetical protein